MGSIRARQDNGLLFLDFYYRGKRCREQTALSDTSANRKKVQKLLDRIDGEISLNTFSYERYFPSSKNATRFAEAPMQTAVKALSAAIAGQPYPVAAAAGSTPLFRDFANTWYTEKEVEWRNSHKTIIRSDLDKLLIPRFGDIEVSRITKAEILAFRAELAKVNARGKTTVLSHRRINKILNPLRQILNEAADRFDFRTPFQNIKQLRMNKPDVNVFTMEEVKLIIDTVRPDYKNYFRVRFFTGMRTGEVDGLKWKYVDFARRIILIRETIVAGKEEYTKNDESQREIEMSQVVYDALKAQEKATRHLSEFVFCKRNGKPLEHKNVTNRVWYPLLRHLKLTPRRPYQCRHTAATLWLASGENPQWIARQLGHANTEMLFRVYARFVPNLTRRDGSAFERMLTSAMGTAAPIAVAAAASSNPATELPKEMSHG
jgi:integrase